MHADEQNIALTAEYGKPIYHYHLHVIAIPVVKKEIKYSKRTKDKSLVGKVKKTIMQVSHSKKWKSQAQQELNEIKKDIDNYKGYKGDIDNIDVGKSKLFGKKFELDTDDYQNLVKYAKKGVVADIEITKLKEDGIMTPTEYYQSLGRKSPTKVQEVKNFWNADTVKNILDRQEYIGDTVNFRSTQRSFKDHTKIDLPKEKWKIFKNHHEPIIDEETWNTVQRIRNNKRRPTKTGKQSIFSGHLFCKDCGAKLYYCTANNFTADKDFYRCSNYKNNSTNACTSHNIRDIVLREIVLEQVQQVISYIHNFEWLFIKEKQNASIEEQKEIAITSFVDKVKKYTEIFEREFQNMLKNKIKTA